ncbi:MAG: class I SAM-dependent methyltransferase [Methanobacteriota archaeon]|nr:MAG: class I SAM-dependent methyltransferase [Euryarchaeota archaeon]
MTEVSKKLKEHYEATFQVHGPTSQGVDWGEDASRLALRYEKMLAVIVEASDAVSILDVGCGFGGLLAYSQKKGVKVDYTGIDVAENMIEWARNKCMNAEFVCGDILEVDFGRRFDYVVCNGILTQKLDVPGMVMDRFAGRLIRRMFDLCYKGIAFNVMTTKVNYFSNNLYYRNPAEMLSWALSEITPYIKIDHSYPLYEYTMYLYREGILGPFYDDGDRKS